MADSANSNTDPLTTVAPPRLPDAGPDDRTQLQRPPSTQHLEGTPPPRVFGDYELISEIARGGMGVVYRARQITLDRLVALKMVLAGRLAGEDDLQRFKTEAEAAARLQHPNIVAVFEVGEVDGQHFFSMEFIDGCTLTQRLSGVPLPGRVAARYLRTVARAVHYAHQQGILHRDLKPSNILLGKDDEPHVTDFGLAKRLGGDSRQTKTGAVLGTPSYMAPEQAAGKTRELGPPCDVYGLGAVLYECLTARPPFKAETPVDTVLQVLNNQPEVPRSLNPKIDADLETICLKCLEKAPGDRYASAEMLARDLDQYLNNESISARSSNMLDRLTRMLDRSQHDLAFHTWSTMLFLIAGIVGAEHLAVYLLTQFNFPHGVILAARLSQFVLIGLIFWRNRGSQVLPRTPAERELWTIWIAYVAAYAMNNLLFRVLVYGDFLHAGAAAQTGWIDLLSYPFSAVLSGMAFFCMGSNYWGRCYAVGVLFFVLAFVMPFLMGVAPLLFGIAWCGTLTALGLHLRRLHIRQMAEQENTP